MPISGVMFKSEEEIKKFWEEKFGPGNYRHFPIPIVQPREDNEEKNN
jgi:hypothetical protein